jgi:hypothetical protein
MRGLVVIIFGALTTFRGPYLLLLAYGHTQDLVPVMAIIIFGLCLVAAGLYVLRNTHRIWYALLEIIVAIFLMISAVSIYIGLYLDETLQFNFSDEPTPQYKPPTQGALGLQSTTIAVLQVAAAIYVFIRGLDNFGEGLRSSSCSKLKLLWTRVFQTASKQ